MSIREIVIQHEWDGTPLIEERWIYLSVIEMDIGMKLEVDAPFYSNPAPESFPNSLVGSWELWNYEVVELFLVGDNGHYTEVEVGPHGHHLILRLDAPRSIIDKEHPMIWKSTIEGSRWKGEGFILNAVLPDRIDRINAFGIATINGERKYSSYTPLPGPKPDFHQPHRFTLW